MNLVSAALGAAEIFCLRPAPLTRPRLSSAARIRTVGGMALKVYTLSNCDRCRAATQWLRARGRAFTEVPIRETPPTPAELRTMLQAQGGALRRLFNTAGRDYREQKLGDRIDALTADEAVALLAANGNLVKRPFAVGDGVALVGFDAAGWAAAFAAGA